MREMIAFVCGGQEYRADVMSVREIRGLTRSSRSPMRRAMFLPIIDLAARLGFQTVEPAARHAFLVVEIDDQLVGLLFEGVSDILTVRAAFYLADVSGRTLLCEVRRRFCDRPPITSVRIGRRYPGAYHHPRRF